MYSLIKKIIDRLSINVLNRIFFFIIQALNKKGNYFFTYQVRPKKAKEVFLKSYGLRYDDVAIVIQGPVIENENFTLETVKLYIQNIPGIIVIISTWDDISARCFEQLSEAGAILVTNTKPSLNGIYNINLQIVSTYKGLQKAKDLGKKFAVKTRTDQRIYNSFFLQSIDLLDTYKNDDFLTTTGLRHRLIVSSMSTLKYRPYGPTDMLMIGHIDDLLLYWPSQIDEREISLNDVSTVIEYARMQVTETYLLTNFMTRVNKNIDFTLAQTWQIYSSIFIVVDKASFNIFWYKYSIEKENRLDYFDDHIYKELSFFEWLSLSKNVIVPEYMLEKNIAPYNP